MKYNNELLDLFKLSSHLSGLSNQLNGLSINNIRNNQVLIRDIINKIERDIIAYRQELYRILLKIE